MKEYVNVIVDNEDFISNGLEDISIKVERSEIKNYYTIDVTPIILDENGKDYILTFCSIDYGGGGPYDCVYDYHNIFKVNEWQLEVLKTLVGSLGKGVHSPMFSCNPNKGKEPKSEAFKKVEYTLKMLGNVEDLLDKMNLTKNDLFSDSFCFLNEVPNE